MCLDFDEHHSGGSSFDLYIIFGFCDNMWAIPTGTNSVLKKKRSGKESQYMVSHPELGLDPPIGSDRDSGRDKGNKGKRKIKKLREKNVRVTSGKGGKWWEVSPLGQFSG